MPVQWLLLNLFKMTYKIDATNQKLGRVASEAATVLMGKHKSDYKPNQFSGEEVLIENASKLDINEKKKRQKTYIGYSGHPGGQKSITMKELIVNKGFSEVLERAVYGMLPNNKLRPKMMKNLKIME